MRIKPISYGAVLLLVWAGAAFAWTHGSPGGGGPVTPGLTLGTYGSTTASGWTTIGPSDGTLPSGFTTNIIYVSDSLGNDNRDGSTPTFVDDGVTEQFNISTGSATATAVYKDLVSGQSCTVAVTIVNKTFMQCESRTGTPSSSGTLTKQSGTGDAALTYSAVTLGIHGPVQTIVKGAGGSGPGAIADLDHTGPNNGDGTGLGTRGAGNSFALRTGHPDWLLLRKGDTFDGQIIEVAYDDNNGSDSFPKSGFSQQEPIVVSSYDENFPATTPDLGGRARPILQLPGTTDAYANMQTAGTRHAFRGRTGLTLAGSGSGQYVVIMGIEFYCAQCDPNNGAYVGSSNVSPNAIAGIDTGNGGASGILLEDTRVSWRHNGILNGGTTAISDFYIRRNQIDHCYTPGGGPVAVGITSDSTVSAGGPIWSGFNLEENAIDLCGYVGTTFAPGTGDSHSRNVYIQGTAVFGNRRGNTSTRSGSEDFQFRSGGIIDNNFTYGGNYGIDIGHNEGMPTLTSATTVTNNVDMSFYNSPTGGTNLGHNYQNSNNIAPTGNIIAHQQNSVVPFAHYAATDASRGSTAVITLSSPGSGGVSGWYGCIGNNRPATFTGGSGTTPSLMNFFIGLGGSVTDWAFGESIFSTYVVGDVLTAVSGTPSINTAGVSLTNAGSGGTPGDYGHSFSSTGCAETPSAASNGSVVGVPLTNFSGSMAGSGAVATFTIGGGGTVSAFEIIGTGKLYQVGDVLTASPSDIGGTTGVRLTVTSVAGLSAWGITIATIDTEGTHALNFTGNIVFNWDNGGPPGQPNGDDGGSNDSPGGVPGSGAANIWTPNSICPAAQFTGVIASGALTSSSVLTGTITIGQNLAGPGVTANTTITGGSGTSWTVSPSQNVASATMYGYTCTPSKVYAHPERTAETYAASLGLTASIDGYMAAVLANAKWNWNPLLTANNGINPYIRAGFQ